MGANAGPSSNGASSSSKPASGVTASKSAAMLGTSPLATNSAAARSSIVQFCRHRTKLAKKQRRRLRVLADPEKSAKAEMAANGTLTQSQRELWWGNVLEPTAQRMSERWWNQNFNQGWPAANPTESWDDWWTD